MSVVVKGAAAHELLRAVTKLLEEERGQSPEGMDDAVIADRVRELWTRYEQGDLSDAEKWEMMCEVDRLGFLGWPFERKLAQGLHHNLRFDPDDADTKFNRFASMMTISSSRRNDTGKSVTIVVVNACQKCDGTCEG